MSAPSLGNRRGSGRDDLESLAVLDFDWLFPLTFVAVAMMALDTHQVVRGRVLLAELLDDGVGSPLPLVGFKRLAVHKEVDFVVWMVAVLMLRLVMAGASLCSHVNIL